MPDTTIIAVAAILALFGLFSVVLAWADRRTRDLDTRPRIEH